MKGRDAPSVLAQSPQEHEADEGAHGLLHVDAVLYMYIYIYILSYNVTI